MFSANSICACPSQPLFMGIFALHNLEEIVSIGRDSAFNQKQLEAFGIDRAWYRQDCMALATGLLTALSHGLSRKLDNPRRRGPRGSSYGSSTARLSGATTAPSSVVVASTGNKNNVGRGRYENHPLPRESHRVLRTQPRLGTSDASRSRRRSCHRRDRPTGVGRDPPRSATGRSSAGPGHGRNVSAFQPRLA